MELRLVDPMCNPYLGAALTIAAGLEGIREKQDPGEPHFSNMYEKTPQELEDLGVKTLPRTLEEALDAFEVNALAKSVFGEKMFDAWLEFKRDEWISYLNHVSDWETKRYMHFY